jgi:probable poly-beta-1,6-N-acetyl-D-glucosamine export protein
MEDPFRKWASAGRVPMPRIGQTRLIQGEPPTGVEFLVFRLPFIRGACILGVIIIHVTSVRYKLEVHSSANITLAIVEQLVSFSVPVFVLLSGFHLSLGARNLNPLSLYRRTLKYLLIPYLFYSLLFAIGRAFQGVAVSQLVWDFFSSRSAPHLWFMPVIMVLYILHPFLRRLSSQWRWPLLASAFGIQLVLWPWLRSSVIREPGALMTVLSFCAELGYFVAGYALHDHANALRSVCDWRSARLASLVGWVVLGPVAGISAVHGLPNLGAVTDAVRPVAVGLIAVTCHFAVLLVLVVASRSSSRTCAWTRGKVERFGLYSYGIYLLHPLVLAVAGRAITRLTSLTHDTLIWYGLVFTVTAVATLQLVRWVARTPAGRYLA